MSATTSIIGSAAQGTSVGLGAATAGATVGAAAAAGAVSFGVGAVVAIIAGIFAHHAAAVRNEADALNAAVPGVTQSWQAIIDKLNAGSISQSDAIAGVDQTLSSYDQLVYGQAGVKQKAGNGPDVVKKDWLQPWADKVKQLISTGGTFQSTQIPAHAGFAGLAPFTLTVAPNSASALRDLVTGAGDPSSSGGSSSISPLWWIAGGLLVLVVVWRAVR